VHYVSSVSVFETLGYFTGRTLIHETESVDVSGEYVALGYSQSKWVAEKLMENARATGLPINIYRAGYIMGHSITGVSNTSDHIARYLAGCIEMGCAPILDEYASLAPVDKLSSALRHIALNVRPTAETYHLCNPSFITVDEIYRKILAFGFPLALVSYSEWKRTLQKVPVTNPLYPLLSLHVHRAPNHALTLPELYERNARFDCTQFKQALEGSGIDVEIRDPAIFERWLSNYVDNGLISMASIHRATSRRQAAQVTPEAREIA
jgi:thioester reductase-like protein